MKSRELCIAICDKPAKQHKQNRLLQHIVLRTYKFTGQSDRSADIGIKLWQVPSLPSLLKISRSFQERDLGQVQELLSLATIRYLSMCRAPHDSAYTGIGTTQLEDPSITGVSPSQSMSRKQQGRGMAGAWICSVSLHPKTAGSKTLQTLTQR